MSAELRRHEETQKAPDNVNTTADSEIDREEELMLQAETPGTQPVRILDFSRDDLIPRQDLERRIKTLVTQYA